MTDTEKASLLREMMATKGWGILIDEANRMSKATEVDLLSMAMNSTREDFDKIISAREYHKAMIDFISYPASFIQLMETEKVNQEGNQPL